MCGIAGLLDPAEAVDPGDLRRQASTMAAALAHRGPDDEGAWSDAREGVAFGHRRLSVVDVSESGHQPMVSPDGRWVITYNGEIYNHEALRQRLRSAGAAFAGGSDTEVLLQAVQFWGLEHALDACEGMFALALWDRRHRELHLVRDRFGEKPLYYGWTGPVLAFASELKAFRTLPYFSPTLDRQAVAQFLRHNCVPAPLTAYREVRKLEPGRRVTLDSGIRPGTLPPSRPYWSPRQQVGDLAARPLRESPTEVADRLEAALDASVALRMVADVPVGAFLSGGIDSSLVVALMQRHSSVPVRTFTVGFEERGFDESEDAAAVAKHLGTDHTPLTLADADALEVIPQLPEIWDEPFADISQIPTLLVSRLARRDVTVSLSGDGGDELFAGYNRHAWLERLWRRGARVPRPLRHLVGSALQSMPPSVFDGASRITGWAPRRWQVRLPADKVVKAGKVLSAKDPQDAYLALVSHWDDPSSLLAEGHDGSDTAVPPQWPALSSVTEQMLWLDLVGYLPDDILAKLDRGSMAVSLESRAPFLDRAVFELAWRIPVELKVHQGVTKWILREVLYRHVPRALVERPKMGFGVPIGAWLRGPLRPWADDLLSGQKLAELGVLRTEPVQRAWSLHRSGKQDLGYELWDVLMLQAWLDRWRPGLA